MPVFKTYLNPCWLRVTPVIMLAYEPLDVPHFPQLGSSDRLAGEVLD